MKLVIPFLLIVCSIHAFSQENNNLMEIEESFEIKTSDDTIKIITVSLIFGPKQDSIETIYSLYGRNYLNVMVIPLLRRTTRSIVANYKLQKLRNLDNSTLEAMILDSLIIENNSSRVFDYELIEIKSIK